MKYLSLSIPGFGEINPPQGLPSGGLGTAVGGSGGTSTAENILQTGVQAFIVFLIILTLITIIWGGFDWMFSHGDKSKIETARLKITWAILGLIFAFLAIFIVSIVGMLLGIDYFGLQTPCTPAGIGTC